MQPLCRMAEYVMFKNGCMYDLHYRLRMTVGVPPSSVGLPRPLPDILAGM
jgi:hypothetical protein